MARSRRTATREEVAGARQPDPNNNPDDSSEAPSAPENNDDDAASNPPDQQEGDFAPDGLDNLDAIIRRDMIAMYVRVLGFKEGAATAIYDDQQITDTNSLDDSKKPDAPKMTLTPATATASFTQMKTHLAKCRGTPGLPLEYVVRPQLKGPHNAPKDGPEDPPSFGDLDSPYVTIDAELIARAPIL